MENFDGIIFDVDGTLWDSTPVVEKAWNRALRDNGIDYVDITADQLKGLFGLPMEDIIDRLLPMESLEKRRQLGPVCFSYEEEALRKEAGIPYPGLMATMNLLKEKYPLFIVSNCQAGYIELFCEKMGLGGYIRDHCCPGDTGMLKAENIRFIAERNGLRKPVYVGDTQMDADACQKAGVPIIYAAYGFGRVKEPDYVIGSFGELKELL